MINFLCASEIGLVFTLHLEKPKLTLNSGKKNKLSHMISQNQSVGGETNSSIFMKS